MRKMFVVSVASALVAMACGDGGQTQGERPSSSATVEILEPEAGAVITGETMTIRIELDGGVVVEETSRDLTPHEGHIHVSIDGRIIAETFELTDEIETPEPGRYLLQVEFVAKDHGPFSPRVLTSVPFEVEG